MVDYFFTVKWNTLNIKRKRVEVKLHPGYKWTGQATSKKIFWGEKATSESSSSKG